MRAAILGATRSSKTTNSNSLNNNTNNSATTTTDTIHDINAQAPRARVARSTIRPPLNTRDKNAMMRVPPNKPPLATKSGNANTMSHYEKQSLNARPVMPTLSAAVSKQSYRAPLTPRVAGSAPPAATTPLSRRGPRSDAGQREELPGLGNNITPRSGQRKSRVDSSNTTPTATPVGTPASPFTNEPLRLAQDPKAYGLGINGLDKDIPRRPTVSFSPAASEIGISRPSTATTESKFFFASEAKTAQTPSRPLPITRPASTFVYANGESIPPRPQTSGASTVGSQVGEERVAPKFFHANGIPDLQLAPSPQFPPRPSSVVSSASRIVSPAVGVPNPAGALSPSLRPSSPSKLNGHYPSISSVRNTPTPSITSPAPLRPQPAGRGVTSTGISSTRRASIDTSNNGERARSSSGSSTAIRPRKLSGESSGDSNIPSTPLSVLTSAISVSTPEEIQDEYDEQLESLSPIKAGHSIEKMNELAADARRERKVLDLEITNSSLEAINRTLEREMRKVTAELRRYRRLSRSGRLSIASTSMRASSETLSIDGTNETQLSDMSEEEDPEEEDESEMSGEDSPDEGTLSADAILENDLKHRKRDEKRLQLDLTKHQQLLIDSQKMNQSLKWCLGRSEVMISEGKKALEYKVRVTDVELGGRVLALDEVEERQRGLGAKMDRDEGEGMSEFGARMLKEAREKAANVGVVTWGNASGSEVGRDDRDSGIELRGDGGKFVDDEECEEG